MANRNPNPRRCDLTIADDRPDSPLGPSGGMVCHHALPFNLLRKFWNCAVQDNLDDFRGTFLRPFAQSLRGYPVCPGRAADAAAFTAAAAAALSQVVRGDVAHDGE